MREITDLREIQMIELDILKFIDKICSENKLTYFLSDGTLIGAIRHKGFIPWDDDLDISMPRPDYEKLIKIMRRNPSERYELKCIENGKKQYNYTFGKMIDNHTQVKEFGKFEGEEIGVWVDIFPLDGLGDDKDKAQKIIEGNKRYVKQILNIEAGKDMNFKGKILYFLGRKNLNRILKFNMKKNNFYKSKYVTAIGWINPSKIMDGDSYHQSINSEFEGIMFNIPIGYDMILRQQYGNYMELPPIEKRKPEHNCKIWWK